MKKVLFIFVALDLLFVGTILHMTPKAPRHIASEAQAGETTLTPGQTQKLEVINGFRLYNTGDDVGLVSPVLSSICERATEIEISYKALNIAYAGEAPQVTQTFSCSEFRKTPGLGLISTTRSDLRALRKNNPIETIGGRLSAKALFSDESFPVKWRLSGVRITGETGFQVSEAELNKILGENAFDFDVPADRSTAQE